MEGNNMCLQRQNPHYFHHEVLDLLDEMLEDQEFVDEKPEDTIPTKRLLTLNFSAMDRCRDQVLISVKICQRRALSSLIIYRNYDDEPQFEPVLWYKTTLFCYVGVNANHFSTTVTVYMNECPDPVESETFFFVD